MVTSVTQAMVYDNRFIPLLSRPRLAVDGNQSSFAIDFFMATLSRAIDRNSNEIGVPELFGDFDQAQLGRDMVRLGYPNVLSEEQLRSGVLIPWNIDGKVQAQSVTCSYYQQFTEWLSGGFSWLFMRVNARHEFRLKQKGNNPFNLIADQGDILKLDQARREMFTLLRLQEGHIAQLGFGDIDLFLRYGKTGDYVAKLRHFDAGIRLGVLIPTGVVRDIDKPASIPFGGNGFWGVYGAVDGLFEIKEDWKVGLLFRINKRFARTVQERLTMRRLLKNQPHSKDHRDHHNKQSYLFSPLVDQVHIDPGVTVIFSPYFVMEHLRQGLGISLQYTLIAHQEDRWTSKRCNPQNVKDVDDREINLALKNTEEFSQWSSDYVTLNVFYDFGKTKVIREFDPIISFRWDIPALFFNSSQSCKTHRISIGVEFAF